MKLRPKKQSPRDRSRVPGVTRMNSSTTFSYYNTGVKKGGSGAQQAEKTIDLARTSRIRLLPSIIAMVVILGSLFYSLTLVSQPSVETLNNEPSFYRPVGDYAAAANEIMSEKLSYRTKFTIRTDEVEDMLRERFPELNAAVLRLPVLGRRPSLVIDIRSPKIILVSGGSTFVLDSSGKAVSDLKSLNAEHRSNLMSVKDESGLDAEIGKQILPSSTIAFIEAAVAQLNAKDLAVTSLTLPASANQLDIRIEGLPYYVKTDIGGDARLQMGSFFAVKNELERQGIRPSEYIDVRVEERAFYR